MFGGASLYDIAWKMLGILRFWTRSTVNMVTNMRWGFCLFSEEKSVFSSQINHLYAVFIANCGKNIKYLIEESGVLFSLYQIFAN